MALSAQFLDELRARVSLSGLIGSTVKLSKAGREHRGCCPFHQEKTPSFYVNDDKAFYHCFGCGAHGDAIKWMTDQRGLPFIDAVRELAEGTGLDMPAPSPEYRAREAAIVEAGQAIEAAAAWYARQLAAEPAAMKILIDRGIGVEAAERFGLGVAPRGRSVSGCGAPLEALHQVGLLMQGDDGWRDRFLQRIMIPIHDARGRPVGFGARATSPRQDAKYVNSAEGPTFDKGRTLYNLHRASPASRSARRLIVVEGYFDVIALDQAGICEVVAPMGTAMTEAQLERAWRVHHRPILLLDGDSAGRAAAMRACERALPMVGPSSSLSVVLLPEGDDPDSFVQREGCAAIEELLARPVSLATFVASRLIADAGDAPEDRAGLWHRLSELAGTIRDDETRAQYLAMWRARYDREVSAAAQIEQTLPALHAQIPADDGEYSWPEEVDESERRLILIVQRAVELRRQRSEITQILSDLMALAKGAGFSTKAIGALCRDIEADAGVREDHEAIWALYRRVFGVKGPMTEAMLPSPADPRAVKITNAAQRRLSRAMVMIEARDTTPATGAAHG